VRSEVVIRIEIKACEHCDFQNESERYRLECHAQGGEKDAERLRERMVRRVGFGEEAMLEEPSVFENQRYRRVGQALRVASVHHILA